MKLRLAIIFVLAILAIIFATQNSNSTQVTLFGEHLKGALSLVLVSALGIGIILGFTVAGVIALREHKTIKSQNKEIKELAEKIKKLEHYYMPYEKNSL